MNQPNTNIPDPRRQSVIYLMNNPSEIPSGLEKFFEKLKKCEQSIKEIVQAGQQAERTLNELGARREQMVGSIDSIAEIIIEELPKDKCEEWSKKGADIIKQFSMAGPSKTQNVGEVDLAGSTAKLM